MLYQVYLSFGYLYKYLRHLLYFIVFSEGYKQGSDGHETQVAISFLIFEITICFIAISWTLFRFLYEYRQLVPVRRNRGGMDRMNITPEDSTSTGLEPHASAWVDSDDDTTAGLTAVSFSSCVDSPGPSSYNPPAPIVQPTRPTKKPDKGHYRSGHSSTRSGREPITSEEHRSIVARLANIEAHVSNLESGMTEVLRILNEIKNLYPRVTTYKNPEGFKVAKFNPQS